MSRKGNDRRKSTGLSPQKELASERQPDLFGTLYHRANLDRADPLHLRQVRIRRCDHHHTDTHVEDPVHFGIGNPTLLPDELKDRQGCPGRRIDIHAQTIGYHPGNVVLS